MMLHLLCMINMYEKLPDKRMQSDRAFGHAVDARLKVFAQIESNFQYLFNAVS
jgi:hypothetical protein